MDELIKELQALCMKHGATINAEENKVRIVMWDPGSGNQVATAHQINGNHVTKLVKLKQPGRY